MAVRKPKFSKGTYFDYPTLFLTLFLALFGLVMIYSTSSYMANIEYGDGAYYFKRQFIFMLIGLVFMYLLSRYRYQRFKRFALLIAILQIVLLVLVLIVGTSVNGSTRWIYIGPIGFQPSEIAKLTLIIYSAAMCSDHPELPDEKKREYLGIACDKARHLQDLIEELFGFTKLGHGELQIHRTPMDLKELLEQLLTELWPVFSQNGMVCEFRCREPLPILGDGTLLARLFDNLLGNAIKYGAEGKKIIVEAKAAGDAAVVRVINYGKVIAPEAQEHLFDRFYRAEASRNSGTGGTGLGLAIARNIAQMHGGSVTVQSSLEEGTVFEVRIPLRKEEKQA